ncbi:ACP S-malonyltransferase [Streptomyces sp. ISL-22]|uniref:ACP S-malonyltransferase n=1 Tax=unclassified Streptomyces TaxID=2593676 RepID=UPI001BEA1F70|nr:MULTISPECIES: ACP S-malonyltransferase [unclassified Streptomyces]MBT2418868.1 ACP S-malonyltransferase [Streptomyces sp. ISL-24]MBT2435699.1 ACP S-malonyltransferase [Streptomyces sp. ISL-22]
MTSSTAFVFPGQGSQFPGMGHELFRLGPQAKALADRAEEVTGLPVIELMTRADAATLADPELAQVLVLVWSLAALERLRQAGWRPSAVAGHSLGEYTALVACGSLDTDTALSLVACRGKAMAHAARSRPGGMAAIVGLASQEVEALCTQASTGNEIAVIANWNSPRQLVVAGTVQGVDHVVRAATRAGALRARRLAVGGGYHSPLMNDARGRLAGLLATVPLGNPSIPFVSSTTGSHITDIHTYRSNLQAQVISPVRWRDTVQALGTLGATTYIEAGPGRVLSGLGREMARAARHLGTWEALRHAMPADIARGPDDGKRPVATALHRRNAT